MKPNDLVKPKHGDVLFSGCSRYDFAIVKSVEPFVLVSQGEDMTWFKLSAGDFEVVCKTCCGFGFVWQGNSHDVDYQETSCPDCTQRAD